MHRSADIFAYLSAFTTIVLALALSDMVQSLHRLLRARARVQWDVLPLLAALYVFLTVLSEFFSLWVFGDVIKISFYGLVGSLVVPIMIAIAACAALPDEVPDSGLDLREFYLGNRRYLYSILALMFIADDLRFVVGYLIFLKPQSWLAMIQAIAGVSGTLPPLLAVLFVLARAKSRPIHLIGLLALFALAHAGYAGWTIEQAPTASATAASASAR